MSDIPSVLPSFSTASFTHLIPALDRSGVTVSDLICSEPIDIARRALLPPNEIVRLTDALVRALQEDATCKGGLPEWSAVSCLDPLLDEALDGGFPVGYLSEITGESGAGKTQFLLTLMLAVQLPPPHGLSKSAIYVSTEAALSTSRLSQILKSHPLLKSLSDNARPSLSGIHSIQTPDLESQDHILRYQVPVAIERFNVGLVIVDSIAANYRAELHEEKHTPNRAVNGESPANAIGMAERRAQLVSLGSHLRRLAQEKNIAIVVSNQVADRFMPDNQYLHSQTATNTPNTPQFKDPASTPIITPPTLSTLDHQQRFFTGWGDFAGDHGTSSLSNPAKWKTPALGLVWANQIAGRIALIREPPMIHPQLMMDRTPDSEANGWGVVEKRKRFLRVAFAAWATGTSCIERGVEYEITGAGVRGVTDEDEKMRNVIK